MEYILHSLWFGMQKPVTKPFVEDMNILDTTGVTRTGRTEKIWRYVVSLFLPL